jgi:serine/threonine protein kinase
MDCIEKEVRLHNLI